MVYTWFQEGSACAHIEVLLGFWSHGEGEGWEGSTIFGRWILFESWFLEDVSVSTTLDLWDHFKSIFMFFVSNPCKRLSDVGAWRLLIGYLQNKAQRMRPQFWLCCFWCYNWHCLKMIVIHRLPDAIRWLPLNQWVIQLLWTCVGVDNSTGQGWNSANDHPVRCQSFVYLHDIPWLPSTDKWEIQKIL